MKQIFPFLLLSALLMACNNRSHTSDNAEPARVVPIYSYVAANNVPDSDSIELRAFMRTVSEEPFSSELVEAWAASQAVAVFTPDVDSVFADTTAVPQMLGNILANAASQDINIPHRRYATVVYGRPESLLFVDSVMLIALNHYLGADYPGYSHWPAYMRQTKTPQALPYNIAEALVATSYPYALEGEDATVLSRMIYEGVLAHAKIALVPGGNVADALGYSDEQMQWLGKNEQALWRSMVQNQLLYDTSDATTNRLVAPSPEVVLVSPTAPGRVGRYIGYRIVDAYIDKYPDTALHQMFAAEFYKGSKTLMASGYQPK